MKTMLKTTFFAATKSCSLPDSPNRKADVKGFADALESESRKPSADLRAGGSGASKPERESMHAADFNRKLPELFPAHGNLARKVVPDASDEAPIKLLPDGDEAACDEAPATRDAAAGGDGFLLPAMEAVSHAGPDKQLEDVFAVEVKIDEDRGGTLGLPAPAFPPPLVRVAPDSARLAPSAPPHAPRNDMLPKAGASLDAEGAPQADVEAATPQTSLASVRKPDVRPRPSGEANAGSGQRAEAARGQTREGTRHPDAEPGAVRVIESRAFPAPAQSAATGPAASVLSAIAGLREWTTPAHQPVGPQSTRAGAQGSPVRTLTIQLHPAELGVVTAKLRGSGEQLSIELQVEKPEAHRQLSADSDTILKAVRSLGIEVDKITILQPQAQPAAVTRSDNAGHNGSAGESGFSAPGDAWQGGEQQSGRSSRETPGNEAEIGPAGAAPSGPSRPDRGVYI